MFAIALPALLLQYLLLFRGGRGFPGLPELPCLSVLYYRRASALSNQLNLAW